MRAAAWGGLHERLLRLRRRTAAETAAHKRPLLACCYRVVVECLLRAFYCQNDDSIKFGTMDVAGGRREGRKSGTDGERERWKYRLTYCKIGDVHVWEERVRVKLFVNVFVCVLNPQAERMCMCLTHRLYMSKSVCITQILRVWWGRWSSGS